MTAEVIDFVPIPGARTYRPEFVLFEGKKRRQWAVAEHMPDGTVKYFGVWRGWRREAIYMANLYTRGEADWAGKMRVLANSRIGRRYMAMGPMDRLLVKEICQMLEDYDNRGKAVEA